MGRKSALTPEQWAEVERRHIVGGESLNALSKEFGVNESSLRRKVGAKVNAEESVRDELRDLAGRKARADIESRKISDEIAVLPIVRQMIVSDLAATLIAMSNHLGASGVNMAAAVHRVTNLMRDQVDKIDDIDPFGKSADAVHSVANLGKLANELSVIPMGLLKANQEAVAAMNRPEHDAIPSGLAHFYGE